MLQHLLLYPRSEIELACYSHLTLQCHLVDCKTKSSTFPHCSYCHPLVVRTSIGSIEYHTLFYFAQTNVDSVDSTERRSQFDNSDCHPLLQQLEVGQGQDHSKGLLHVLKYCIF